MGWSGYGCGAGNESISDQITTQLIAIVATIAYTAVLTAIILKVIDVIIGLRVDEEQESVGLDLSLHEEKGYDL